MTVRVLIVDDSALVRKLLREGLNRASDIEVVATAKDPYEARDLLVKFSPDVMTLDIEMPKMDGIEFLHRLMPQFPIPTIVVSSLSTKGSKIALEAIAAGAVDVVGKPSRDLGYNFPRMMGALQEKIRAATSVNRSVLQARRQVRGSGNEVGCHFSSTDKVVAIGASTGGTEAIAQVLRALPVNCPGVVVVQHMPPGFIGPFAERLNATVSLSVSKARHWDNISAGRVLVAPIGKQCEVVRAGGHYKISLKDAPPVGGHCPAVDVLMASMAREVKGNGVGVLLTGMGRDGAQGMKWMRDSGAHTIGQNQETCVVYGMPKMAKEMGGICVELPVEGIANGIIQTLKS